MAAACIVAACALIGCGDKTPEWTEIDASTAASRRATAERARDALASELVRELTAAIANGDVAKGITVCKSRAPAIAEQVAKQHGVTIGRTSMRLRNPTNRAPQWATKAIAQAEAKPRFFEDGADKTLGALFPILLGPQCVVCHGKDEELAPAAKSALSEHYPDDQATGFSPGDLRGWFWVEVPRSD
ncbi:MAG: DUF3365 domain-containing protein [Planctomycetes bacterium]|nr:DUF3365 domain-containing protein [Planctomycetota bacterium]